MQFIINGQILTIDDLNPPTDRAFVNLHAAYLSNLSYNWADFEHVALEFFDVTGDSTAQDKFFSNFTIIWQNFLRSGHIDEAENVWKMALMPAFDWEAQHPGKFIHKGTPFYFWGMTSILKGDLDRGYTLVHRSVEEDCRTSGVQFPDTPGFALATLNYAKTKQFFIDWVVLQANYLSDIIDSFNKMYAKGFHLDDFRRRFLTNPPNIDTVFLLVYTLARLSHLQGVPEYTLQSNFAGQLEMNLLFDVTLVIDAAIKGKNPNQWRFQEHAIFLANAAGLVLNKNKLDEINNNFKNDFDQTLATILDGSFRFADGSALSGIATDLTIAYGLRNHAAHNVSSVLTIWKQFLNIRQRLFNTLFLVAEVLY